MITTNWIEIIAFGFSCVALGFNISTLLRLLIKVKKR